MKTKLLALTGTGAALLSASAFVMAQPAMASHSNSMSDQEFATMFTAMDSNKDGMISRAEYAAYHNSRYDTWDSAKKGMMTRDQIRTKMFERELRKTDGNPQGNSTLPGSVQLK